MKSRRCHSEAAVPAELLAGNPSNGEILLVRINLGLPRNFETSRQAELAIKKKGRKNEVSRFQIRSRNQAFESSLADYIEIFYLHSSYSVCMAKELRIGILQLWVIPLPEILLPFDAAKKTPKQSGST